MLFRTLGKLLIVTVFVLSGLQKIQDPSATGKMIIASLTNFEKNQQDTLFLNPCTLTSLKRMLILLL
jgi:pyridoxal biosynthesis lyase PdxS